MALFLVPVDLGIGAAFLDRFVVPKHVFGSERDDSSWASKHRARKHVAGFTSDCCGRVEVVKKEKVKGVKKVK